MSMDMSMNMKRARITEMNHNILEAYKHMGVSKHMGDIQMYGEHANVWGCTDTPKSDTPILASNLCTDASNESHGCRRACV